MKGPGFAEPMAALSVSWRGTEVRHREVLPVGTLRRYYRSARSAEAPATRHKTRSVAPTRLQSVATAALTSLAASTALRSPRPRRSVCGLPQQKMAHFSPYNFVTIARSAGSRAGQTVKGVGVFPTPV